MPPQRIVLVTIDTLRADHLSGYGYERPTSPQLDELMRRGATFWWAFSTSSNTAPSHASILTGAYPASHSVGAYNGQFRLEDDAVTLAELLRERGLRTGAVVSNPVLSRQLGLDQGFEAYDDELERVERNRADRERTADVAVSRALEVLKRFDGQASFLWLHLQDPHGPYDPPPAWLQKFPIDAYADPTELPPGDDQSGYRGIPRYQLLNDERRIAEYRRRYDAEIAFTDAELGRLVAHLDATRHAQPTLLIVTADHGEAFGEDEFYFSHSHSLDLGLVRVPLVLVGPGVPAGVQSRQPVSIAWIFDTVLDFVGVAEDGGARPARSLLRGVGAEPGWAPGPAFLDNLNQVAVADGAVFARRDRPSGSFGGLWRAPNPNTGSFWKPLGRQVVSLESGAEQDIEPETRRLLNEHLVAMWDWQQRHRAHAVQPTPEQLEALRALGYVD